ncbi:MAG TPA: acyltransferase [Polyangiaceae bacterium]|nr:acyltransferase [Polyangiaceae bacterium]
MDGIRGIAAVYVELGHIYLALTFMAPEVQLTRSVELAMAGLGSARLSAAVLMVVKHLFALPAVQVFIVLSGYCLMLPVLQNDGVRRGGFGLFFRRRAVRILPPYFTMLAVGLAITATMDALRLITPPFDDLRWDKVVSHVLLVHNWSERLNHAIDPPMWSIAVEWQIYFVFALLLLPIWRRLGDIGVVACAFAVGFAPHFLLDGYLDWCCPWFLGLFALGMAAAHINLASREGRGGWYDRLPWGWLSLALWVLIAGAGALNQGQLHRYKVLVDPIAGLATMTLLVSCTRALERPDSARSHPGLRVFGSRLLTRLGAFSYSIYLAHYPLMLLFFYATLRVSMSVAARTALMYAVFFPVSLAAAYVFYVFFERPFVLRRPA